MTQMVMPNDTNPLGNLMGGNLLRWMDIASGICAGKHAGSVVVTVSADSVLFKHPIKEGDVLTIVAKVTCAFTTSMEVHIEVFKESFANPKKIKCNEAYFSFVALNEEGRPQSVPPVLPITEKEEKQCRAAQRRREMRLVLAGRLKPQNAKELQSIFLEETDLKDH